MGRPKARTARRRHRHGRRDAARRRPRRHDPLLPRRRDARAAEPRRPGRRARPRHHARRDPRSTRPSCGTPRRATPACSTPRSSSTRARRSPPPIYSVASQVPRHLHGQRRPPRERGLLLHRPRGQRRRALLRPRPLRRGAGPTGRSRWPRSSSTRTSTCASTSPRAQRMPRHPAWASATPSSATCTSRSATSRARASSTSTGSASRPPPSMARPALFVSAGGYHHHMAMNTWNSARRRPAPPRARARQGRDRRAGRRRPRRARRADVAPRRRRPATTVARSRFDDPWANLVEVRAAAGDLGD